MDIVGTCAEYGAKNLRVFMELPALQYAGIIPGIAFVTSDSPVSMQECVIDESFYQVADNYKITFRALDPMFGKETYYISDLESIICDYPGKIRIYVVTIDGYQRIEIK